MILLLMGSEKSYIQFVNTLFGLNPSDIDDLSNNNLDTFWARVDLFSISSCILIIRMWYPRKK